MQFENNTKEWSIGRGGYPQEPLISAETSFKSLLTICVIVIAVVVFIFIAFVAPTLLPILIPTEIILLIAGSIIISGVRIPNQWENLVIFNFGKFKQVKGPGIQFVIPFIEFGMVVDMRVLTIEIPKQSVITRDNVPIEVDGVLFFNVESAEKAIVKIQNYRYGVAEYARNSLRDVVGGLSLDDVLSEREKIQEDICKHIQEKVLEWGLKVDSVRLQDIVMPEDLKKVMSRQASAEREKRATIIKAEGDKLASINLSEAAETMTKSPGAMQLRTLQTIDGLGASASNTIVLFPVDIVELIRTFKAENV